MNVSRAAKEKRIEWARRNIKSQEKCASWTTVCHFDVGFLQFAFGLLWIGVIYLIARMPGNPGQAFQNAAAQGMALGMLFGFLSGGAIFLGGHHVWQGIESVRGNPVDQMLVEYDALLALLRSRALPLHDLLDADLLQEPDSLNQPSD
jgi:hypothetical protein